MTVGKSLVRASLSDFIRTLILERSHMGAATVEKLSGRSLPSFFIRKFTMEGKATNVISVGKASCVEPPLLCMEKFMMERQPLIVGRPGVNVHLSVYIRKSTWSRMSISAENVGRPSFDCHPFYFIEKFTMERRQYINATNVGDSSIRDQSLLHIKDFMLEGKPMKVRL